MMINDLSPATVSPDNNTSRTEYFQQTDNSLQASGGNLQSVTGSQNGNWQDILNSNSVSIAVPGSQAAPSVQSPPAKDAGGFGWLPLSAGIILFLVVVIAVVRFKRKQAGSHRNTSGDRLPETKTGSQPQLSGQAAKPKPTSKKRKGKKQSGSRRKRG